MDTPQRPVRQLHGARAFSRRTLLQPTPTPLPNYPPHAFLARAPQANTIDRKALIDGLQQICGKPSVLRAVKAIQSAAKAAAATAAASGGGPVLASPAAVCVCWTSALRSVAQVPTFSHKLESS